MTSTTLTTTAALSDARAIALDVVTEAGSLLTGSGFETRYATWAFDGAMALAGLNDRGRGYVAASVEEANVVSDGAVRRCAAHHLAEHQSMLEEGPEDHGLHAAEVARALRVLDALGEKS